MHDARLQHCVPGTLQLPSPPIPSHAMHVVMSEFKRSNHAPQMHTADTATSLAVVRLLDAGRTSCPTQLRLGLQQEQTEAAQRVRAVWPCGAATGMAGGADCCGLCSW